MEKVYAVLLFYLFIYLLMTQFIYCVVNKCDLLWSTMHVDDSLCVTPAVTSRPQSPLEWVVRYLLLV